MTTIHLTEDLECFIRDAVSTGRYPDADSVISDALIRLSQTINPSNAGSHQSAEPLQAGKQLTKQEFQRHLVQIGLLDEAPKTQAEADDPDVLIDAEGEIVSEVVIRERLIEWLAGFLETK